MDQFRKTPRANFLDYEDGDYFITICTRDRKHYFGKIINGTMMLSDIGKFAQQQLNDASMYKIRGNHDGNKIAEYIENNVAHWGNDCFFQ